MSEKEDDSEAHEACLVLVGPYVRVQAFDSAYNPRQQLVVNLNGLIN